MAAKTKRAAFFCTECGNETPRWEGKCPACGAWNSLAEPPALPELRRSGAAERESDEPRPLGQVDPAADTRWLLGVDELDFVLGGGVVPGSVLLIAGDPGVGKSTLLLQTAARLERTGRSTLYVSGEESAGQVGTRAERLGEDASRVAFLAETSLSEILRHARERSPDVLLLDSIQTAYADDLDSAPGSVGQVRECAARLQRFAKDTGTAVTLVGHVTKGGGVAGPKTLEHIVDVVLRFEGARGLDHRLLRATKNRFGAVDEIGVFRMTGRGLVPVPNPSELFLGGRGEPRPGSAVLPVIEGSRPLLVEVQALAVRSSYGSPQRVSSGLNPKRLALLLAVLERSAGIGFGSRDVFVNVAGGVRLTETAADAAVIAALASSVRDRPLRPDAGLVGEVGLGGELRPVGHAGRRLAELARMGFSAVYLPARNRPSEAPPGLEVVEVADVPSLLEQALG
ncbi:MAG: DNA repair protein RadA [Longimicrobiaceae bacterium]